MSRCSCRVHLRTSLVCRIRLGPLRISKRGAREHHQYPRSPEAPAATTKSLRARGDVAHSTGECGGSTHGHWARVFASTGRASSTSAELRLRDDCARDSTFGMSTDARYRCPGAPEARVALCQVARKFRSHWRAHSCWPVGDAHNGVTRVRHAFRGLLPEELAGVRDTCEPKS